MIEPPSKAQNTYRCQFGLCLNSLETGLLFGRRKILARSVRQRRRHANALAQLGFQVNGFAIVHRVCSHLNRQRNLANHVARVRAHPSHFGVGVDHRCEQLGVEGRHSAFFVALQFARISNVTLMPSGKAREPKFGS